MSPEELLLADLRLLDAKLAELERLVDAVDLFLWDEEVTCGGTAHAPRARVVPPRHNEDA